LGFAVVIIFPACLSTVLMASPFILSDTTDGYSYIILRWDELEPGCTSSTPGDRVSMDKLWVLRAGKPWSGTGARFFLQESNDQMKIFFDDSSSTNKSEIQNLCLLLKGKPFQLFLNSFFQKDFCSECLGRT
jgi:hypothetical protein